MTIRFPVLRTIQIGNYGLFPNGLAHTFSSGVNLVVGINGLGKTTFLNVLYRVLVGPRDLSKDDTALSSSQHAMSPWRQPRFFRARVMDDATSAIVRVRVTFGSDVLVIQRSLRDLDVQHLHLNGKQEEPTQARYEELIQALSGTATYFDFAALLRFLVFFLEDRPQLIWDQRSQFDMLRLLFYDRTAAREAAQAYDAVQSADSKYRNRRVPIRAADETLQAFESAENGGIVRQIKAMAVAVEAAREAMRDRSAELERQDSIEGDARLRREQALLELEEAQRAYEREQQLHYAHVFPGMADTAKHVFLNLLGGGGCLVCGDRSAAAATRVVDFTKRGQCPICESVPERQENVVPSGEFSAKRLRREADRVEKLRRAVAQQDDVLAAAKEETRSLLAGRQTDYETMRRLEGELDALREQIAPNGVDLELATDPNKRKALEATVTEGNAELSRLLADRLQEEQRYKKVMESQAATLASRIKAVKGRFKTIAQNLLAERCELGDELIERSIGQEGERIAFPAFAVRMSSGVFLRSLSKRADASSVSESQREFIDLAFRMALMDVASEESGDTMLVIETPEASLDSLFIESAGTLFRSYAAGGGTPGNVFVASTNLNNESMVSALLGATPHPDDEPLDEELGTSSGFDASPRSPPPPSVPPADREGRIVNLLELAAANAALRRHGAYYRAKLAAALYPDVPASERPRLTRKPEP